MKKPTFSFKAALGAAARRKGAKTVKVLSSMQLAHLFGFGKTESLSAPAGTASANTRPPAARKTAAAVPAAAARRRADEDEEMHGTGPIAAARRRERARCEAIINSPAGLKNPGLAQTIAFASRMTRKEGIALLDSTPAAATVDRRNHRVGTRPPELSATQGAGAARMDGALAAEMARTNAARSVSGRTA